MSTCSIPTKADDAKYDNLVDKYEDMGPIEDPAFQEAIKILRQSSPTQLHAEMRACKRGGKRRSRKNRGGKRRHRGRSRKARGGEGEDDELATPARAESMGPATATVGTATEAEVPESKPAPAGTSKTMCYLRAMAKLSAMTAMLAGVAFNYIAPFLANASGVKPCEGFMDQAVGTIGSYLWDSADCAVREEQFNMVVAGYTSLIVSVVGLTGLKMVLKSPLAFKLALRYLAARECPGKFDDYSKEDFANDMKELKDSSMFSIGEADKGAKKAPASKAAATTKAAPVKEPETAKLQAAPSQAASVAASPAPGYENPDDALPVRRSARLRKGGKKHTRRARSHKRKATAKRGHRRSAMRRR